MYKYILIHIHYRKYLYNLLKIYQIILNVKDLLHFFDWLIGLKKAIDILTFSSVFSLTKFHRSMEKIPVLSFDTFRLLWRDSNNESTFWKLSLWSWIQKNLTFIVQIRRWKSLSHNNSFHNNVCFILDIKILGKDYSSIV